MAALPFTCPHCKENYELTYFNAGWENLIEMRCDSCPTSLYIDRQNKYFLNVCYRFGGWNKDSAKELHKMLKKCDCGGGFKADVPYRCKLCFHPIDIEGLTGRIKFGNYRKGGYFSNEGFSVIVARKISSIGIFDKSYKIPPIYLALLSGLFFRIFRLVKIFLTGEKI